MDTPFAAFPKDRQAIPDYKSELPNPYASVKLPIFLLVTTIFTTLTAGFFLTIGFLSASGNGQLASIHSLKDPLTLLQSLTFSFALLSILLAHEMGHYIACRLHGIQCTLPYVIPAPPNLLITGLGLIPVNPFGTFGAIIRIRSPFRSNQQIYDIGIAGPLAGFVTIIPLLALGVILSNEMQWTENETGYLRFGEPLLFKIAVFVFFKGDPHLINLHPIGWAAWFGLLATSLNLLPFGQLDGGHVVYALFGEKRHKMISAGLLATLVALSIFSFPTPSYIFFAMILFYLGFKHPYPMQQNPLDFKRRWLSLLGLVVFIVSFIPIPITLVE